MSKGSIFYLISALTVLSIRLGVFLYPAGKVRIDDIPIYHFWIGVALLAIAMLVPKKHWKTKLAVFSFGFAAFADELAFMLRGDGPIKHYWAPLAVWGMVAVMGAAYLIKDKLIKKIL